MKKFSTRFAQAFSAFLLLLSSVPAQASHLYGGELWWECLPNGQVIFKMRLYRDCNGIPLTNNENIHLLNYPTMGGTLTVPMTLITSKDLSPSCSPFPGSTVLSCGSFSGINGNGLGAIQENY